MVKIEIRCPSCSKIGYVEVEDNVVKRSSRGITAINVAEYLICEHSFVAYIDKDLTVRDCFLTDFQIELPSLQPQIQMKDEDIAGITPDEIDLVKNHLAADTLTNLLKALVFQKPLVLVEENEKLYENILGLFQLLSKDTFQADFTLLNKSAYKKNKKKYKSHVVISNEEIIRDKQKILNPKKAKIENVIVRKFLEENDPKSSIIILKNELQKAYELASEVKDFFENASNKEKLTPKLLNENLNGRYDQEFDKEYLRFLIQITQNAHGMEYSNMFGFNQLQDWFWYLS